MRVMAFQASCLYLYLPFIFLSHCLEEWILGFPEWANRHFGAMTTRRFYFLSHVPLLIVVSATAIGGIVAAEWPPIHSLGMIIVTVMFTNALFHLGMTFYFRVYSPGVGTSIFLTSPFSWAFYSTIPTTQMLSWTEVTVDVAIGITISGFIVYSLTWRRMV